MRNGKLMSHAELPKTLCGLLKSALKFYTKAVEGLKEEGFGINPHDGCVANKLADRKHQTAC